MNWFKANWLALACTAAIIGALGICTASINTTIRRYAPDYGPDLSDIAKSLEEIAKNTEKPDRITFDDAFRH